MLVDMQSAADAHALAICADDGLHPPTCRQPARRVSSIERERDDASNTHFIREKEAR
jgi:hypothetical protein